MKPPTLGVELNYVYLALTKYTGFIMRSYMPPTLGAELNYVCLALTKYTGFIMRSTCNHIKIKNVLQGITAYTCLIRDKNIH